MANTLLVRWTVGPVLPGGLQTLRASMAAARRVLRADRWVVCHNGIDPARLAFCRDAIPGVRLVPQSWADSPLPVRPPDTRLLWAGVVDNEHGGGSLWKLCPPRIDPAAHELVLDNDIVLVRRPAWLDAFLAGAVPLAHGDVGRSFGRYDRLFRPDEAGYNAGLYGLPPGFDLGAAVRQLWESGGRQPALTAHDEQGLVARALTASRHVLAPAADVPMFNRIGYFVRTGRGGETRETDWLPSGREAGYHFVGVNRENHRFWRQFRTRLIPAL